MKEKSIIELFKDSASKLAKKKGKSQNSIYMLGGFDDIEHYKLCPFRSISIEDCPLCTIDRLKKL